MLRKETKEFLQHWPLSASTDPSIQKIRKKYEKRNPSQMYNRAVRYANDIFDDLHFILQYLPEKYIKQVDIEKGVRYLYLEETQMQENKSMRIALAQVTSGMHVLRQILRKDLLLEKLFLQKLIEMEGIANLLYEISIGKIPTDKKSRDERNRRLTKVFDEFGGRKIV